MSGTTQAVIFDGDDTLWKAQVLYDQAMEEFYDLLETQGFDRHSVKEKLDEIDVANVHKYGFSIDRFPLSMEETYKYFCQKNNQPLDTDVLQQAARIGYSVFERTPEMMSGADTVLAQLQPLMNLYFYSGGNPHVQERKLELLDLGKYFVAIHIAKQKNEHELKALMQRESLAAESTWMVGNSLKSDINPALKLGLRCIWVRSHSWTYDREEVLPGHMCQVTSLVEIPSIILRA